MDFRLSFVSYLMYGAEPTAYNCSGLTEEEWRATGTRQTVIGLYFMISGVILEIIYIPCLIVMARNHLKRGSCYKIMFVLGILDCCCLLISSLLTGYLGYVGAVYCTDPVLIRLGGAFGLGCWCATCSVCIILALNRTADLSTSKRLKWFFEGNRLYCLLSFPVLYFLATFLTPTPLFHSKFSTWLFNPMIGLDNTRYINPLHAINNCSVCLIISTIYLTICIQLILRAKGAEQISRVRKAIILQAVLICSFNLIASYIYVYMQFFPVNFYIILSAQVLWQFSNGIGGIIYLTMNTGIQRDVLQLTLPVNVARRLISHRTGTSRVSRASYNFQ